jgi:hypothetical protein
MNSPCSQTAVAEQPACKSRIHWYSDGSTSPSTKRIGISSSAHPGMPRAAIVARHRSTTSTRRPSNGVDSKAADSSLRMARGVGEADHATDVFADKMKRSNVLGNEDGFMSAKKLGIDQP